MKDCQMLGCVITTSLVTGIIDGTRKTKGKTTEIRILSIATEILKSFNKHKGPKLLVRCATKKKTAYTNHLSLCRYQ